MTKYEGTIKKADRYAAERIRKIVGKHIHQNEARKHPQFKKIFEDYKVLLIRRRFPNYRKEHKMSLDTIEMQAKFRRVIDNLYGKATKMENFHLI